MRGTVIAVVSLVAALVAGLLASMFIDTSPAEPELSAPPLHFTADNRDPTPLVGRNTTGDVLPGRSFARLEGGTTTFDRYRGKPLVINFFASTCPPCIQEMPAFEAVHRQLADTVGFVGVSLKESMEDGRALVARTKVTYDILRDPSGSLANDLGVVVMPSTFFVSPDGAIVDSVPGALSAKELRAKIAELMR
ncbi:MAG: TlpA family protein disulfide reductase [Actinobacteria bacterium]|nr:TlpA family protein disulfide reductase [Actinomycetota bacterium]